MVLRTLLSFILLAFFVLSSLQLRAQTQHTFSGWSAVFGSAKLNSRFSLHFDGQLRSADKWREVQTILLRPGLHYHVRKNHIATLGYAFVYHHRRIGEVDGWGPEHRIWEQYIINQPITLPGRATTLQHRLRVEQRFIGKSIVKNDELATETHQFAQRLRYFARWVVPVTKTTVFKKGAFISLQNEVFVNIGDTYAVNGKFFDQNRVYGSVGYRFSPKYDMEVGFMNQYVSGRSSNTSNNILQLAGYVRL